MGVVLSSYICGSLLSSNENEYNNAIGTGGDCGILEMHVPPNYGSDYSAPTDCCQQEALGEETQCFRIDPHAFAESKLNPMTSPWRDKLFLKCGGEGGESVVVNN